MKTDYHLIEAFKKGFTDYLNGEFIDGYYTNYWMNRAYNFGSMHAQLGDDCESIDLKTDAEILSLVKNSNHLK
jgi:hypothetical protein